MGQFAKTTSSEISTTIIQSESKYNNSETENESDAKLELEVSVFLALEIKFDIKEVFMPFFTESFESLNVENSEVAKSAEIVIGELEDIIMSSNNSFIELGIELIEPFTNNI
uniref:Uncharacterized protein n=1 Tax=Rhizophagus irregularis (strain DAOM 181602 / DAOM 197198 / MUCL 43194) TaxID=747089 RepID=U9SVK5_RHIID